MTAPPPTPSSPPPPDPVRDPWQAPMRQALDEAAQAASAGDVPVGAVVLGPDGGPKRKRRRAKQ
ncbi:tRNA-specific adenosine deaminase, partial [Streptomyces sp. FT05W]